jgi:hypothetical protein
MSAAKIKLGWFNAWIGLSWLILFVPCLLFLFKYTMFLEMVCSRVEVSKTDICLSRDGSDMRIQTDKGTFYSWNNGAFDRIRKELKTVNNVKIWYDKEDMMIMDIYANNQFLIPRSLGEIVAYAVSLIVSGFALTVSILLIIKTKGWGSYGLLEKHPTGLLKYLSQP